VSSILSPRREIGEFKKRYKWMALVVLAGFTVLLGRIVQLQLIEYDKWASNARDNITKTVTLPATRGIIRDTNGRIVATNRPAYTVYVVPQLLAPGDVKRIAELMGLAPDARARLEERLSRIPAHRRLQQVQVFTDIDRDQLAALETHSSELPGLDVVATPVRTYPYGKLGAHTVGYLNEVSAEDLEALADHGYRAGELLGRTGVERAFESYLRGKRGFVRVLVNARGERMNTASARELHTETRREDPIPGRDLSVTLDMDLMRSVERAFRGHPSGAVVVLDAQSGEVRALYSKPAYDLNEMSARLSQARFQELMDDPFRPLIDKTVYESYFPGSTFKPFSALAALGDDVLDPATRVDCPGFYELGKRRFRCTHAHGEVDMKTAIVRSCNVYFWKLAEQVGLDRIHRYAREFGFGRPTGIGINSEASGFVPNREWYRKRHDNRFRIGFTLNTAIGQGNTRATVLQLALAYGAMANGGTLNVPQLVEAVTAPDGKVIERFQPRVRRRVAVDEALLSYVREGLYGVANDKKGTAFDARIAGGVAVAGKTGTAQVARGPLREGEDPRRAWYFRRDHAWFAGYAPAKDPRIVVVALVEHGGAGGKTAAPIAMQVIQEYLGPMTAAAGGPSEVVASRGRKKRR
jgi:penicillin-binding protein 2